MRFAVPPRVGRVLRTAALNFSLLAVACFIGALAAELAVRIIAPQQLIQLRPDVWQPADSVGWLHQPDVSTEINTGERTVHVYTDHEGFRVGTAGRTEEGTPVLVLGDSFMEALQVEYEQSYAGLLERALAETLGQPVAVRNAGIDGYGPGQYLIRARRLLPREPYALVVTAIFVGNDASPRRLDYMPPRNPAERHRLRFPRRVSWGEFVDAFLRPVNDALETRSHLFVFAKNRLQTLRMRAGLSPLYFPTEFLRSEADAERWTVTADLTAEIAAAAEARGAAAVFVLVPESFQVDAARFARFIRGFDIDTATVDLEQPNRRLRDEMAARGLTVLDVLSAFRDAHAAGQVLYGEVDPHLSPRGHELLLELTLPTLVAALQGADR